MIGAFSYASRLNLLASAPVHGWRHPHLLGKEAVKMGGIIHADAFSHLFAGQGSRV